MVKKTKVPKHDFRWVGVRFINNDQFSVKEYTYKVKRGAKLHLGMELVVHNERGSSIVVVTKLDRPPEFGLDTGNWKWIRDRVAPI